MFTIIIYFLIYYFAAKYKNEILFLISILWIIVGGLICVSWNNYMIDNKKK